MKHEHKLVRKMWHGMPYYWCDDPKCGVAVKVTKLNAKEDPQKLLDSVVKELSHAKTRA
jgi:hypothetical protein